MSFVKKDLDDFARGDTWTTKFTLTDANDVAIDITGFTFWLTLKTLKTDADPGVAQVETAAGSPDAALGIIFMTISNTVTNNLAPGKYHYDLQQVDDQSPPNIQTLLIGRVTVATDITRSIA